VLLLDLELLLLLVLLLDLVFLLVLLPSLAVNSFLTQKMYSVEMIMILRL